MHYKKAFIEFSLTTSRTPAFKAGGYGGKIGIAQGLPENNIDEGKQE